MRVRFDQRSFRRGVDAVFCFDSFRSGLWRIDRPWYLDIWTPRFWRRQQARYKIWRATGHHFLWTRKRKDS